MLTPAERLDLARPAEMAEQDWSALRSAIVGSMEQSTRLSAGSEAGAEGEMNDHFASAVALSGDTALVGAPPDGAGRGSVYVFVRAGDAWTLQAKLQQGSPFGIGFGAAVSLDQDTALIGAPNGGNGGGAAYVFSRTGNDWSQVAELLPPGGGENLDQFGASVALSGDTVVVGASG
ncbi:MAG: FG-GAP repeat protein, partial [Xanthomonadales bacterium]|nr:FG-GAP repeat protein [Xanthomonadales bacterium]